MSGSEIELLPDPVVSNSGPLISLSTIGKLDVLKALFDVLTKAGEVEK